MVFLENVISVATFSCLDFNLNIVNDYVLHFNSAAMWLASVSMKTIKIIFIHS